MNLLINYKNTGIFCLVLFFCIKTYANDGSYYTSGGMIYPMKENKISIDKEILTFKVIDKTCYVNVLFEFNNPENIERKLLVGFQAPSASGDVSNTIYNICQIKDFTVVKDGNILPYQLKKANDENGELKDPNQINFSEYNSGIFVFLFEVTFKPGINKIHHSYSFPSSSFADYYQQYTYIITTGAKWAGGKINNFTMQLDMGENSYYYVRDVFGANAKWEVVGTGKVTDKYFKRYYDLLENNRNKFKMIRVLSGFLQITSESFLPTKNIVFGSLYKDSFVNYFLDHDKKDAVSIEGLQLIYHQKYTIQELKLMRNTVYAQHGYAFKNIELKKYFNRFEWYIPNPNLKLKDIELSIAESKFIKEVYDMEKNYK